MTITRVHGEDVVSFTNGQCTVTGARSTAAREMAGVYLQYINARDVRNYIILRLRIGFSTVHLCINDNSSPAVVYIDFIKAF